MQEISEREVLKIIFIGVMIISIISLVWDFSITYFSYYQLGDKFLDLESNKLFVWGIRKNIPILLNPSLLIQLFTLALSVDIFLKYLKNKNYYLGCGLVIMTIVNFVLSIGHIIGGLSWF